MFLKSIALGPVAANCYVICDNQKNGAVIDAGGFNPRLERVIAESGMERLQYIICTHGHFDHTSGVSKLKSKYPDAKIVIGKEDAPALSDPNISAAAVFGVPFEPCYADVTVSDGDILSIGEISLKVISSPGHTQGGVVLYCEEEHIAFTGDTLFKGSVGRTDLYGGSYAALLESLKKIKKLPAETVLLCGHGENTTVEWELKYNPYLV